MLLRQEIPPGNLHARPRRNDTVFDPSPQYFQILTDRHQHGIALRDRPQKPFPLHQFIVIGIDNRQKCLITDFHRRYERITIGSIGDKLPDVIQTVHLCFDIEQALFYAFRLIEIGSGIGRYIDQLVVTHKILDSIFDRPQLR